MITGTCSYCKKYVQLTKEHIFPDSFYKELGLKGQNNFKAYNIDTGRESTKELKKEDVCEKCNNVILSELDQYFIEYFKKIIYFKEDIILYNIKKDSLNRWLLKTLYNAIRYINMYSKAELYKKHTVDYILYNKRKPNLLVMITPLDDTFSNQKFDSNFCSIGTYNLPSSISKKIITSDFFQCKDFIIHLFLFDSQKNQKNHQKKIICHMKKEYNSYLIVTENNLSLTTDEKKLANVFIYNANENFTNIPFKIFCRLDWSNLTERKTLLQTTEDYVKKNHKLFSKGKNKESSNKEKIYFDVKMKHYLWTFQNIPIILYTLKDLTLSTGEFTIKDIDKIKEFTEASTSLIRKDDNTTIITIIDLNDTKPFMNMRMEQHNVNWDLFKNAIKTQNNFVYIAYCEDEKIIQQIKKRYLDNVKFISKIKVTTTL